MEISLCTKADFDQIRADTVDFWGSDRALSLHHPIFLYEFGNSAFVIKDRGIVAAYLFGFISQAEPIGYAQFLAVRPAYRGQGLATHLYEHFTEFARARGCTGLKAFTRPFNAASIAFHKSIGMELLGEPDENGVPVIRDYAGPGEHRVVFRKRI